MTELKSYNQTIVLNAALPNNSATFLIPFIVRSYSVVGKIALGTNGVDTNILPELARPVAQPISDKHNNVYSVVCSQLSENDSAIYFGDYSNSCDLPNTIEFANGRNINSSFKFELYNYTNQAPLTQGLVILRFKFFA